MVGRVHNPGVTKTYPEHRISVKKFEEIYKFIVVMIQVGRGQSGSIEDEEVI